MTTQITTADELDELDKGDELHVTLEDDRTLPLTVTGIKPNGNIRLGHDGQRVGYIADSHRDNDNIILIADAVQNGEAADVDQIEVQD